MKYTPENLFDTVRFSTWADRVRYVLIKAYHHAPSRPSEHRCQHESPIDRRFHQYDAEDGGYCRTGAPACWRESSWILIQPPDSQQQLCHRSLAGRMLDRPAAHLCYKVYLKPFHRPRTQEANLRSDNPQYAFPKIWIHLQKPANTGECKRGMVSNMPKLVLIFWVSPKVLRTLIYSIKQHFQRCLILGSDNFFGCHPVFPNGLY